MTLARTHTHVDVDIFCVYEDTQTQTQTMPVYEDTQTQTQTQTHAHTHTHTQRERERERGGPTPLVFLQPSPPPADLAAKKPRGQSAKTDCFFRTKNLSRGTAPTRRPVHAERYPKPQTLRQQPESHGDVLGCSLQTLSAPHKRAQNP